MLAHLCMSTSGRDLVDKIHFLTDPSVLVPELDRTAEMREICLFEQKFPESGYEDTLSFLRQMEVQSSFYPDVPSMVRLQTALTTVRSVLHFFAETKEGAYPALKALCAPVSFFPAILQRLDKLLDRYGNIRDNASAQLAEIRSSLKSKEQQVQRKIHAILKQAQEQGVTDPEASVSVREGRMLIPVPAANKKKIEGYICDESASGKTVFIEPAEVVNLNNQIRELGFAEQREILVILRDFAGFLQPYIPDLIIQAELLAKVDFLRAKARAALRMEAGKPVVAQETGLFLLKARHPLLEPALKKEGKSIVPLTLKIDTAKRILLISGPNAGGKSVCLKTVGLLQYMFQCGLLIPASETSEFSIFESLFLDIGDEQSLENDLSTYSSHLLNMREILNHADDRSLILIDEFGAGTEPAAGGAIAEALLEQWEQRGAYGVITTHYTNLKFFATTSKGVLNGAMQFDVQHIRPLFKLETGVPGNSFAFELARKMGLPRELIRKAQEKAGAGFVETERYIRNIARNRRKWEEKVARIKQTDKTLENITDKYQAELTEIRSLRKKMLEQARTDALKIVDSANKKVENTIKEIRESQAEKEKTKLAREDLHHFKESLTKDNDDPQEDKITRKMEQLRKRKEASEKRKQKRENDGGQERKIKKDSARDELQKPPVAGDKVKTVDGTIVGEILKIKGPKAGVGTGQIITWVDMTRLLKISQNEYRSHTKMVKSLHGSVPDSVATRRLNFSSRLDVRGMRAEEALQEVSRFLDDAFMTGVGRLEILHGTGTGVLKTEIRKFLKNVPGVVSFQDEHIERGGAGITIVLLE